MIASAISTPTTHTLATQKEKTVYGNRTLRRTLWIGVVVAVVCGIAIGALLLLSHKPGPGSAATSGGSKATPLASAQAMQALPTVRLRQLQQELGSSSAARTADALSPTVRKLYLGDPGILPNGPITFQSSTRKVYDANNATVRATTPDGKHWLVRFVRVSAQSPWLVFTISREG